MIWQVCAGDNRNKIIMRHCIDNCERELSLSDSGSSGGILNIYYVIYKV